jgi:hypothetical protein
VARGIQIVGKSHLSFASTFLIADLATVWK